MIVSYRDKRTLRFAEGSRVKAFDGFAYKAELKLEIGRASGRDRV